MAPRLITTLIAACLPIHGDRAAQGQGSHGHRAIVSEVRSAEALPELLSYVDTAARAGNGMRWRLTGTRRAVVRTAWRRPQIGTKKNEGYARSYAKRRELRRLRCERGVN
jgi:hypothetical protein